jgi:hypothetical protein
MQEQSQFEIEYGVDFARLDLEGRLTALRVLAGAVPALFDAIQEMGRKNAAAITHIGEPLIEGSAEAMVLLALNAAIGQHRDLCGVKLEQIAQVVATVFRQLGLGNEPAPQSPTMQ